MVKNLLKLKEFNPAGIGVGVLCIIAFVFFTDIEALKLWVADSGAWAPFAFILVKITTVVVAPLSGGPLYPLAGLLFGFKKGLILIVIGDLLGLSIAFYISRIFGQRFALLFIGKNQDTLLGKIFTQIETPKGLLSASFAFLATPELLAYGAGLTRVPYVMYIAIFMPVWIFASSIVIFLGAQFGDHSSLILFGVPILVATLFVGGLYILIRK